MKIVVGVSGGVDSAYAALSLKSRGHDVVGVHLNIKGKEDAEDGTRLQLLERSAGIRVIRLDCRKRFDEAVIRPFLEAYRRGDTPNPCVICNEAFKIRILTEIAGDIGAERVASGHYARISDYNGRVAIKMTDTPKDQTYVLHRLPYEWLEMLEFPLADIEKRNVKREVARVLDTNVTGGESQDICFLEGSSLEGYLRENLSAEELRAGMFVDERGNPLGAHKGLVFYTEGQRKGLGLSRGPWFVKKRDFSSGNLFLSHGSEPKARRIYFRNASWQQPMTCGKEYNVKICYRFPPMRAVLTALDEDGGEAELLEPSGGVSIGQSLVFYDEKTLMGGGYITASE